MSFINEFCFSRGEIDWHFHEDGSLSRIRAGSCLINSMITAPAEGQIGQIILRVFSENGITAIPLTGHSSHTTLFRAKDGFRLHSESDLHTADVSFQPDAHGWLWTVDVLRCAGAYDLISMQDIGLADTAAQRTNELYTAQYLGHHVLQWEQGFLIVSRQNMPQSGGRRPCLWQGALEGTIAAFSTDGTQFYGNTYRKTGIPAAYTAPVLASGILQGESACLSLQTERRTGPGRTVFFACFEPDHPDVIATEELPDLFSLKRLASMPLPEGRAAGAFTAAADAFYTSPLLSAQEIAMRFPERELEEIRDGALLSFYLPDHRHVVLQEKELLCERPHGTILTTLFDPEELPDDLLTSTAYMYGNFAAQTVLGNTSFHKLTNVNRGLYDTLCLSGTRIWIELDGRWHRLALPAAFVMDLGSCEWYYKLPNDMLTVSVYMTAHCPAMCIRAATESGRAVRLMVSMRIVMGDQEYDQSFRMEKDGNAILLRMAENGFCRYPDLYYRITASVPFRQHRDEVFYADCTARDDSLLTLVLEPAATAEVTVSGDLYGMPQQAAPSMEKEAETYRKAYSNFLSGLKLSLPGDPEPAERINHTLPWHLHNAMVHFCVPHGLEQTGGAAWGTRDICQGPFELFLATKHFALARKVLLAVFSHQQPDGDWPQWFMFDRYDFIHAGESHGDVLLWPMKCAGDYLIATHDGSILNEVLPWLEEKDPARTLAGHLECCIRLLEDRFISGTNLLRYGGGDWDDTLQPAKQEYKDRMSSSWTQALAFQAVRALLDGGFPEEERLKKLSARLEDGFRRMLCDECIPGFCLMERSGKLTRIISPGDDRTGIHYRLIPHTRSILAGLTDSRQTGMYLNLIEKHLLAPDGAHLLDRATHYSGGNSRIFVRAEQAANVGREIGLQYVHAHIRYIGALAAAGHAGEAWEALLRITPPLLEHSVPGALPRQSNMYFSSSDADVPNREVFEKRYADILEGKVPVKGGWRLYSSGPGIYLALLIGTLLKPGGQDPLIPDSMDGLIVESTQNGIVHRQIYCASSHTYRNE